MTYLDNKRMAGQQRNEARPALRVALARGLVGRCPNCGRERLFRAYLKQVDHCASCGENYSEIESDDAAPWFTMLIVGVLAAPLYFIFQGFFASNFIVAMICFLLALTLLTLVLLPRIKGGLIAAFWYSRRASHRVS